MEKIKRHYRHLSPTTLISASKLRVMGERSQSNIKSVASAHLWTDSAGSGSKPTFRQTEERIKRERDRF